jgi:redox-sensitive bicupin YhaK (pirin superfamily)
MEGAGVRLKRAFGFQEVGQFDPFLLLDDFHSDNPADYLAGFPWHPHRGIETVTYVIHGLVEHGDSLGNRGSIESGDIQWMTAGGGIVHQEMPKGKDGLNWGLQLWVNLPAARKMMEPRYQDIAAAEIPVHEGPDGVKVRVIAGRFGELEGPVRDIICEPEYLDVSVPPSGSFVHPVPPGHTVFAYVLEGQGRFADETLSAEHLVRFGDGDQVQASADAGGFRFILVSGKPIGEPVAWRGPIVMNTQEELNRAFREYADGTFIKS